MQHLVTTWLVALGSNFSASWILIANGWMQNPAGAVFNPDTMRMDVEDFVAVLFNPVAQAKFVHTVNAGYVLDAVFVMSTRAFYLLRGKHSDMARRSFAVAAAFGLLSSLSEVVLGDESGYAASEHQKMKLAAIEAIWETEAAPADFTAFGIPNQTTHRNDYAIKIPCLMGLVATGSLDEPIPELPNWSAVPNTASAAARSPTAHCNVFAPRRTMPKRAWSSMRIGRIWATACC